MNEILRQADRFLFTLINGEWHNQFFDAIMPLMREKYFWIPVYAALLVFLILKFNWKSMIPVFGIILNLAATDQLSSAVIKPMVRRLRPCRADDLAEQVRLLVDCGSGFSFVSSHASNHFGLAFFLITFLLPVKWISYLLILWAAIVSYAQVYSGLHYPFDVVGGAALGIISGKLLGYLCRRLIQNKKPLANF